MKPEQACASDLDSSPITALSGLLTLPQAAGLLAVSKRTLEREIAAGSFPQPLRIGRAVRVAKDDVVTYLDKLRNCRR